MRDLARRWVRVGAGRAPRLYALRSRRKAASSRIHEADFEILRGAGIRMAVDVGANRGQSITSILAASPTTTILAFEANPRLFSDLLKVADRHRAVTPYAAGCGAAHAVATLYTPIARGIVFDQLASVQRPDTSTVVDTLRGYGFTWCNHDNVAVSETGCVIEPLDALLAQRTSPVDFLKIDVEGTETDVVLGAMRMIETDRPILLVERPDTSLLAILGDLGYHERVSRSSENSLFHCADRHALHASALDRLFVTPDVRG